MGVLFAINDGGYFCYCLSRRAVISDGGYKCANRWWVHLV